MSLLLYIHVFAGLQVAAGSVCWARGSESHWVFWKYKIYSLPALTDAGTHAAPASCCAIPAQVSPRHICSVLKKIDGGHTKNKTGAQCFMCTFFVICVQLSSLRVSFHSNSREAKISFWSKLRSNQSGLRNVAAVTLFWNFWLPRGLVSDPKTGRNYF